jgi:DNA polymerase I-like protein with 3'-5' exonuclease and polymerase domains
LVDIDLKLKGLNVKTVHIMHDEIVVEAKIGIAEVVARLLKDTMEEAGRSFLKVVSVEAAVVIVESWVEKLH